MGFLLLPHLKSSLNVSRRVPISTYGGIHIPPRHYTLQLRWGRGSKGAQKFKTPESSTLLVKPFNSRNQRLHQPSRSEINHHHRLIQPMWKRKNINKRKRKKIICYEYSRVLAEKHYPQITDPRGLVWCSVVDVSCLWVAISQIWSCILDPVRKSFSFNQTHKLHFSYKVQEKPLIWDIQDSVLKKRTVKKKKSGIGSMIKKTQL